ncbi:MAG: hypothetical protein KGZ86_05855 [Candidatus Latescibacteria bacterium]|nr:hypothetical protein [Candidatus Latescibacterota bacterium]
MKKLLAILFGIVVATSLFAQIVPVYDANVELHPAAINLSNLSGTWVTGSIGFSAGAGVRTRDIVVSTVRLVYGENSAPAIQGSVKDNNLLMVKFDRSAAISVLPNVPGQYLVSVVGDIVVNGALVGTFLGTDTITILNK